MTCISHLQATTDHPDRNGDADRTTDQLHLGVMRSTETVGRLPRKRSGKRGDAFSTIEHLSPVPPPGKHAPDATRPPPLDRIGGEGCRHGVLQDAVDVLNLVAPCEGGGAVGQPTYIHTG